MQGYILLLSLSLSYLFLSHKFYYFICSECGVEQVGRRLRECLGTNVGKKVGWRKWEHVKDGKLLRMQKIMKSGTVDECVSELLQELGPLSRHVFNAEWQQKQLQSLKKAARGVGSGHL